MPQFTLYRIEDGYDGPVAVLNIFRDNGQLKFEIRSKSSMIRDHLKQVLSTPFYQISPISYLASGLNASYALYIQPETRQYIMYLSDRLGWYGYILRPIKPNLVAKSAYELFYEQGKVISGTIVKSAGSFIVKAGVGGGCTGSGGNMYMNKKGELVVIRVPKGCMAVSDDGRVVGPGKWLHARVDVQDSPWHLVELPESYYAQYTNIEGEYKKLDKLEEELERQEDEDKKEEVKKKIEKRKKAVEKFLQATKRMLSKKIKSGKLQYSPAYHLVTSMMQKEEVETGDEKEPKIVTEFVTIDPKELEEFNVNLEEVLENARRITINPDELSSGERASFVIPGTPGTVNYRDAVYMNIQRGVLAVGADGMKRVLALMSSGERSDIPVDGWMFVLPGEYENLLGKPDAIIETVETLLENGEAVHPWLAGQYHAIKNGKKYGLMGGGFSEFAKKYNLKQSALRNLKINKEFVGRITSYVGIDILDNSSFLPREGVKAEIKSVSEKEAESRENVDKRNTIKKEFDQDISKIIEITEDGTLRMKEDVSDIEDTPKTFADVAGTNNPKEFWNEAKYSLTREGSGNYQAFMAKWMSNPKLYRKFGGPIESVGFDLNAEQGTGKTIMILAADAAMREKAKDHFFLKYNGKRLPRPTVIMAPNAPDWVSTIKDARKSEVLYIDGPPEKRQQLWEELFQKYATGQYDSIPKYIVIGTGKVRKKKEEETFENELGEEETAEVSVDSTDVTYLKMLASGFKTRDGKTVAPKGLISNFVLDEAGLFVNPKSTRTKIMRELRALITDKDTNDGLFFTLNGEAMSNGIDDTIYRLAYSNDRFFGNEEAIAQIFGEKRGGHRQFKTISTTGEFLSKYKDQISSEWKNKVVKETADATRNVLEEFKGKYVNNFSLNSKLIVGKTGIAQQETEVQLSGPFEKSYYDSMSKYAAIRAIQRVIKNDAAVKEIANAYSLGMLTMTITSSVGAVSPRSAFEYGINDGFLRSKVRDKLIEKYGDLEGRKKFKELKNQLNSYLSTITRPADEVIRIDPDEVPRELIDKVRSAINKLGRVPLSSKDSIWIKDKDGKDKEVYLTVANRQKVWEQYIDEEYRKLLDDIVYSTPDSVTTEIIKKTESLLKKKPSRSKDSTPKLVIGGPSRVAMDKVVRNLKERFGNDVKVLYVNGDVSADDRHKISVEHQTSKTPVVTVVTTAGSRGLNLQSPNMIALPMWSAGLASQMHARARRNPAQDLVVHKVIAHGALAYVNTTERQKVTQSAALAQNIFGNLTLSKEELEQLAELDTIEEAVEAMSDKISAGSILDAMIKNDPRAMEYVREWWGILNDDK